MAVRRLMALLCCFVLVGCMKKLRDDVKPTGSIIGKKTQDIQEFDPKAGRKVSDSKVEVTNPITGSLQAYGPMLEQISKTYIDHALALYNAETGKYPKDHKEFMDKIIKANNIELPVLPRGMQYQYDVKEHKLVVVERAEEPKAEKKEG